jgi:N utilization substance protein B
MSTDRRHARVLAMQALAQWDVQSDESPESLSEFMAGREAGAKAARYASELVRAFWGQRDSIDRRVCEASPQWALDRMSPVVRNVIRVAILERIRGAAPPKVVLNEAIEITREYADEDAARFVNGVLDAVFKRADESPGNETDGAV